MHDRISQQGLRHRIRMQSSSLQPHVLTIRTLLAAREYHFARLGILTCELLHSAKDVVRRVVMVIVIMMVMMVVVVVMMMMMIMVMMMVMMMI